ncbi:hypothetical protein CDAR_113801 [Caerostris darwini]|uniref:Uncharacterized protein n=1 Tax=Caerostris darwini TaxID=1538125 RepID=A0AAV4UZN5_9ARAC|nr:hypothetical protein CDAR_113801 [Caerostris darwini]
MSFAAECAGALGMESGDIKDHQINASSSYNEGSVGARNASLTSRKVRLQEMRILSTLTELSLSFSSKTKAKKKRQYSGGKTPPEFRCAGLEWRLTYTLNSITEDRLICNICSKYARNCPLFISRGIKMSFALDYIC